MNLFIVVNSERKDLSILENEIFLEITSLEDIDELLKDEEKIIGILESREDALVHYSDMSLEEQKDHLDYLYNEEFPDITHEKLLENDLMEKRVIKEILNYLEKPFKVGDFKEHSIFFKPEISMLPYLNFMLSLDKLTIDVSYLSNEEIDILKTTSFNNEPMIQCQYNLKPVTLSKYIDTMDVINKKVEDIKKYNLSPLEQIMFVYDFVKESEYKEFSGEQDERSRDLSNVLFEEEIVCVGYVNVFIAVLNSLGIPASKKSYNNEDTGHTVATAYINDPVYNFVGIMEFDPTWDSRDPENKNWQDEYEWFCINENSITNTKLKLLGYEKNLDKCDSDALKVVKSYRRFNQFKKFFVPEGFMKDRIRMFLDLIIKRYELLKLDDKIEKIEETKNNLETYILSAEEVEQIYKEYIKYFSKKISKFDFIEILYRTRRVQHSIDPLKYPLDLKNIEAIVEKKYPISKLSQEERLLIAIFGEYNDPIDIISKLDVVDNIPKGEDIIECDAKRMQLINVLKKGLY